MVNDPIADMLTRMRNAMSAKHKSVSIPTSKTKLAIAELLKSEGFIEDVKLEGEGVNANLVIEFKFGPNNEKVINGPVHFPAGCGCRRLLPVSGCIGPAGPAAGRGNHAGLPAESRRHGRGEEGRTVLRGNGL